MAKQQEINTEVPTNVRDSIEYNGRFGPFHAYAQKHPDKDFIIVNHAKGEIQRHEQMGWRIVRGERLYESEFEQLTGESAGQSTDGFAHLPCGLAGEGKPTFAVLMWAPKGTYDKVQKRKAEESRARKASYSSRAENKGQSRSGGIESYDPLGRGLVVDTIGNSQS